MTVADDDEPPIETYAAQMASWTEQLRVHPKHGAVLATLHNALLILRNHAGWPKALAYNERADVIEWRSLPPVPELASRAPVPAHLHDDDEVHVRAWLERSYGVAFADKIVHDSLKAIARQQTYDPVRDWLSGLKWDEKPRLDSWLVRLIGAEDTPLNRAVGAKWLISAVARVFDPGCQADHLLVLEGPQGAGKSSALRALCADPRWLATDMPDLMNLKAAQECLQGPWILEIGELDAMNKADLSRVKSFITTRADRYRAAYAHNVELRPRRCVFAGTTNENTYLKDPTGGRRFWPVTAGRIQPLGIAAERSQLWAEAVARYQAGERWHLETAELHQAAQEAQSSRYAPDVWEQALAEVLLSTKTKAGMLPARITISEALVQMKVPIERQTQSDQNRIARCMTRLGWERVQRRDGPKAARSWAYEPSPVPQPVTPAGEVVTLVTASPVQTASPVEQDLRGDGQLSMIPPKSPLSPLSPVGYKKDVQEVIPVRESTQNARTGLYARAREDVVTGDDDSNWEFKDDE